jgi:hypothetical protein
LENKTFEKLKKDNIKPLRNRLIGKTRRGEKMPIGKEEWDSACKYDTFEKRILSFLRKNRDNAYPLSEIVSPLGYSIEIRDLGSFVGGVAGY